MYQEIYSDLMKTFKENDVFIPKNVNYNKTEVNYFIYNDNQTGGNNLEKLCLT